MPINQALVPLFQYNPKLLLRSLLRFLLSFIRSFIHSCSMATRAPEGSARALHRVSVMDLHAAITRMTGFTDLDPRGEEILAAAISLRDATGRDRKQSLQGMCSSWGVLRREKISGKWKNRALALVDTELQQKVCAAAERWHSKGAGRGATR